MSTYQNYLEKPPVVFISYSWTNDEHVQKVLDLAKRLMSDGIDVKIDKWDLKEGQDKYDFMEMMVKDDSISKILIICDRRYSEKANSRKGGVGSETQIITPEIYNNIQQTKFVPIIFERDEKGNEYLPAFLKSRIYIDLSVLEKYEDEYIHLIRVIFERPENQKPPIGIPPSYLFEEKAASVTKTISKINQFKHMVLDGKPYAVGAFEDYLDNLYFIIETDFKLEKPAEGNPLDELIIESINSFLPYRDEFIEILQFIVKYRMDKPYFELLYRFFNKLLNIFTDPNNFNSSPLFDNYRFITWELFLYCIALLIFKRKYEEFQIFVESPYYFENQYSKSVGPFIVFRPYMRTLDELRKQRLNSNINSISVNELQQRNHKNIKFDLILQADFILFLRSKKLSDDNLWYPSTLICALGKRFEFFIKAEYRNEFNELLRFLDCKDKNELLTILNNDQLLRESYFFWAHVDINELTNFGKLGTR